jgi:hypothetical protein
MNSWWFRIGLQLYFQLCRGKNEYNVSEIKVRNEDKLDAEGKRKRWLNNAYRQKKIRTRNIEEYQCARIDDEYREKSRTGITGLTDTACRQRDEVGNRQAPRAATQTRSTAKRDQTHTGMHGET